MDLRAVMQVSDVGLLRYVESSKSFTFVSVCGERKGWGGIFFL